MASPSQTDFADSGWRVSMAQVTGRPDVDADVGVDFDHHSDEFNLNEVAINAELRRKCPVAWNENYGGFWFLTSYDAVSQAARDDDNLLPQIRTQLPHRRR